MSHAAGGGERIRDLLAARGLSPKKRFGQNFLVDTNFAQAVARAGGPDERSLMIEVGPGTGALTGALLNLHPHARVLAIELDPDLAALLRDTFAGEINDGRLTLIEGDALAGKHAVSAELLDQGARISKAEQRPRRVLCANLPYNAATPLIANLAQSCDASGASFVERIVATIQLELAERLLGAAGSSDYGPLAAFLALRGRGRIARTVGPQIFWPRPRVDSAVVELDLPTAPWPDAAAGGTAPLQAAEAAAFMDFLHQVFAHRRKVLRGALLKKGQSAGRIDPADPRLAQRAEALPPAELLDLFRTQFEAH